MDLLKYKKFYLLGIKGVGMTMLAQFLKEQGKAVSGVDIADVFMTDAVVAKLLARDGAQIERHRQAYEYGEDMVRVVLRPRYDGGYNVEDGRHRVIAAKQAGIGMIEAKLIGC